MLLNLFGSGMSGAQSLFCFFFTFKQVTWYQQRQVSTNYISIYKFDKFHISESRRFYKICQWYRAVSILRFTDVFLSLATSSSLRVFSVSSVSCVVLAMKTIDLDRHCVSSINREYYRSVLIWWVVSLELIVWGCISTAEPRSLHLSLSLEVRFHYLQPNAMLDTLYQQRLYYQ